MASITWSLGRIKNQLTQLLEPAVICQVCRDRGYRWRRRVLGPVQTVHLFVLQLLAGMSMAGLRHPAGLAFTAAALCQAKARLPLAVLRDLVQRAAALVADATATKGLRRWQRLRVFVTDGTGLLLADTPALTARFGKPSGQQPGCGLPVLKWVAMLDTATGAVLKGIALPLARQEMTVVRRLIRCLGKRALLLGDRGFASFAHVVLLTQAHVRACFRLPKHLQVRGRGKGRLRWLQKLGTGDCLVIWKRPQKRSPWLSRRAWLALPQQITLRQVRFTVRRRGYRTRSVVLITTLLDSGQYPKAKLAELYATRWRVEVCFRDMKRTMGLQSLRSRTVAGVSKELLAFVLAYNLVRLVMAEAAKRQGVDPERVSFVDALRWVLWVGGHGDGEGKREAEGPRLLINPKRTGRVEPRVVKRVDNDFPRMTKPRATLRKSLTARAAARLT